MITAAQAREKSMEKITQIAKEFITNCAEPAISEAISEGRFKATPAFEGTDIIGEEVVRLLQQEGFKVDHVYYDGPNGYYNYILIEWEELQ